MAVRVMRRILSVAGWLTIISVLFFFTVTIVLVVIALRDSGVGSGFELAKTDNAVAVVPLKGEILSSRKFRTLLKQAEENESIKGIVVQIDSPGGAVGASEEIYAAIKAAGEREKGKPVVCALSNIAASGGLYAAMGCKKIVTNRGTLTGSIGVILMLPEFWKIADRFGFQMNVIKSGQFKDAGTPFRQLTKDEGALFQGLVDKTYEQFVQTVSAARGLPVAEVKKFADGRVIVGEEAVSLKLVDEVGDVVRAAKIALQAAGKSEEPELIYQRPEGFWSLPAEVEESKIFFILRSLGRVRLLYQSML